MEKSFEDVLNFVKEVIDKKIPHRKFEPCCTCSFEPAICCGCNKYTTWKEYIHSCPITKEEQETIDFINELRHICNYNGKH